MAQVKRYANQVKGNDVNPEMLIESYLESPAYYPEWRNKLFKIAMEEYNVK